MWSLVKMSNDNSRFIMDIIGFSLLTLSRMNWDGKSDNISKRGFNKQVNSLSYDELLKKTPSSAGNRYYSESKISQTIINDLGGALKIM